MAALVKNPQEREWLKAKLQFGNEPSLRERLGVVLTYAGPQAEDLVRDGYLAVATDTRNYLTHFTPKLKGKASEGVDLFVLAAETMALLELCFLRDLGFDPTAAFAQSAGTPLFQSLLRRKSNPQRVFSLTDLTTDAGEPTEECPVDSAAGRPAETPAEFATTHADEPPDESSVQCLAEGATESAAASNARTSHNGDAETAGDSSELENGTSPEH